MVARSIFRCSNTQHAVTTLPGCMLLVDPAVFQGLNFPHLKLLRLECAYIRDDSLQILIDGYPTLEILLVYIC